MIGRQISPYDKDIFKELLTHFPKDRIKLDYDILHEPCIFYNYNNKFQLIYKLSKDGKYLRSRRYYVIQAANAIYDHIKQRAITIKKHKINYKKEAKELEDFQKAQQRFQKEGFRDNLPNEEHNEK